MSGHLIRRSDVTQLSLRIFFVMIFICLKILLVDGQQEELNFTAPKCIRTGDRYVKDYIQYECFIDQTNNNNTSADPSRGAVNLIGKPIGCVPTNRTAGPVIVPGATHTTLHFRYECIRDQTNTVTLKISHCVDNAGQLVKIGDFFSQPAASGEHVSVECAGDEFKARKIVHKCAETCWIDSGLHCCSPKC